MQFMAILAHTTLALRATGCDFNPTFLWLLWAYCITLIMLFVNFYVYAYLSKGKKSE